MKGINLTVYYNPKYRGCANGGISERFDELILAHDRGWIDINGDEENLVQLIHRKIIGGRDVYHLAPMDDKGQYMFGGNYADGDSRFSELHGVYGAIPIHDRREW